MFVETHNCVECGEFYEAFVHDDGTIAGSGRCPSCQIAHMSAMIIPGQKFKNPEPDRTQHGLSFTRTQVCKSCGQPYEARYLNIIGHNIDGSHSVCKDCWDKDEASRKEREEAVKTKGLRDKREEYRQSCGISPRFQDSRFTTWVSGREGNVDKVYQQCFDYAEKFPLFMPQGFSSLIITSPRQWGLGKTHLVSAIAHRILDRWMGQPARSPVRLVNEPVLFARIRATYNRYGDVHQETEDEIIKELLRVPLLIIDDMGKEEVRDPSFVQRMYYRLINGRYDNRNLPIVITANKSVSELREYLGGARENEASFNRLLEMCQGAFVEMQGKSYRLNKKA